MKSPLVAMLAQIVLLHVALADTPLTAPRTFIPGALEVAPFVPPKPTANPKTPPPIRVDQTITVPASGKTLTLMRGEASILPDIPKPSPIDPQTRNPGDLDLQMRERQLSINLGASVYDHRISFVSWLHPETGATYEAVCGFDVSLLAGVGGFTHDGEPVSLMLVHTLISPRFVPATVRAVVPDLSAFPEWKIVYLRGNPNDDAGTLPIRLLARVIESEKDRLHLFQTKLRASYREAEAWEKANPVLPRDETYWFRPHRGSRYLANPRPETSAK